ncbi:uncharacterized protein LOC117340992 [Pecten maximus]|uniref:uncharacterized protein LOC117340992 n=1 Tax=Pecten maximus TaxID=6579 RepID=UPI001458BC79|nr:uncharacterized protein LOC117340992 [Pecten maximus]
MKSSKNHLQIGPRPLKLVRTLAYEDVMENLKNTFFPSGKNFTGKIAKMEQKLGNAKGETIAVSGFTLGSFVDSLHSQKARIYLLTKPKLLTYEIETSSSDSDFSLPDLGFGYIASSTCTTTAAVGAPIATGSPAAIQSSMTFGTPSQALGGSPSSVHVPVPLAASFTNTSTPTTLGTPSQASGGSPSSVHVPVPLAASFTDAGTPTVSLRIPDGGPKCCICYERPKSAFFMPCGHTACMVCGVQLQSSGRPCHQCRARILFVNSLFD